LEKNSDLIKLLAFYIKKVSNRCWSLNNCFWFLRGEYIEKISWSISFFFQWISQISMDFMDFKDFIGFHWYSLVFIGVQWISLDFIINLVPCIEGARSSFSV
jgi:hypothetical protein